MTIRLVPDVPFPAYSYVPGRSPHPISDPKGHSFGITPPVPSAVNPERWAENKTYLYGLDLFNARYYWESHVELEALWLACGRQGVVADFLKGLIKLAAAGVKHLAGVPDGVQSHARRAADLWREVARLLEPGREVFMGLRLTTLIESADSVSQSGWPDPFPPLLPALPDESGR